MPDNVRRWNSAGGDMAMMALLLSDGYTPAGINGTLSNGSSASLKRMYGVKTTPITLPQPTIVPISGDNTRLAVYAFDSEEAPNFQMGFAEADQDIINKVQGTNIYTVGAYYDMSLIAPLERDFKDCLLWIVQNAKSTSSGNRGSGYVSLVVPTCNLTYLRSNIDERAASTYNYFVNANAFDTFPWGGLIGNNAFGKDQGYMFEWFTNRRPQLLTIKDNTSTDTYTLDAIPWTDDNGNVRFIAWRNGVVVGQTGATGSVSVAANKTVDISGLAGRTAGDTIIIFAEKA